MTITPRWDNDEKTTIHLKFEGEWTWDEMSEARRQGRVMMDSVPHSSIDFIIDLRATDWSPLNPLRNLRRFIGELCPKTGVTVIVGMGPLLGSMLSIFGTVYKVLARQLNYTTADTLDEARAIIAHKRSDEG